MVLQALYNATRPVENKHVTTCNTCRDVGMYGGKLPPSQYAGPWKWCSCSAASELRDREPDAVDNANAAREKLIGLASNRATGARLAGSQGSSDAVTTCDEYKGEF